MSKIGSIGSILYHFIFKFKGKHSKETFRDQDFCDTTVCSKFRCIYSTKGQFTLNVTLRYPILTGTFAPNKHPTLIPVSAMQSFHNIITSIRTFNNNSNNNNNNYYYFNFFKYTLGSKDPEG